MLLPDLPYNAPIPDEVSPAARALGRDVQGLSDTMIQGATAMGQAIVQTKTIDAHLQASQKMNDLGAEIRDTPAFAPDALKARLGDSYQSQIPEEVRKDGETQVQALDKSGQPLVDANGQPVMKQKGIPNFYAAQALYQKESQAAIDGAAEQIPGVGWQGAFKRAAAQDAMGQWNQLHEHMLTAWHQDQIDSRARQILTKAYSAKTPEDWSFVNAMVEGSREIFGDDGQTKMRQQVGGLQ